MCIYFIERPFIDKYHNLSTSYLKKNVQNLIENILPFHGDMKLYVCKFVLFKGTQNK